jgi:hypothetical protein
MPSEYIKKKIEGFESELKELVADNQTRLKNLNRDEQAIADIKIILAELKEIP